MDDVTKNTYQDYLENKDSLFYLFCLIEKLEEFRLPDADFPIQILEKQHFNALYCQVPTDTYSEEKLLENLQNWEWLAEQAQKHEQVISFILEQGTVIPFKFGTIFKSFENLEQLIIEKEELFIEQLHAITNKREWDVKVFYSETENSTLMLDNPQVKALEDEISKASPGKQYMLKRKKQQLVDALKGETLNQIGQNIYTQIDEVSQDTQVIQNNFMDKNSGNKAMVFSCAYLVDRTTEEVFHDKIEAISDEIEPKGLFIEYSGPWAPYHFIENTENDKIEIEDE